MPIGDGGHPGLGGAVGSAHFQPLDTTAIRKQVALAVRAAEGGGLWDGTTSGERKSAMLNPTCSNPSWLLTTTVLTWLRPRRELVLENLLLRHQLAVLTRPTRTRPRARLRVWDRLLWVLASRFCDGWREHLAIVTPDTVVRWHRQGWRLFWHWKSRLRGGRPQLSPEVRDLIVTMSRENCL